MIWIPVFIILVFILFFNLWKRKRDRKLLETVTKTYRGTRSERDLVLKLLKNNIPAVTIYHDLYVKKYNGEFSQIDVAVATKVGIIVFEVKDYSGWIFGNGNQNQWTQVLAYGREKYRFYNPIIQNNRHIAELRKKLRQFDNIPFYSVIVFYGNCELREINYVPEGTYLVKPYRVIKLLNQIIDYYEPAPYTNKHDVIKVLKAAVANGENSEIQAQHVRNIQNLVGKHRIFE